MREDEDEIRHYMPVVRRIVILLAVLTAVPVVMWTITAFVRDYVGPPKTPTFRPMAATATRVSVAPAAAPGDTNSVGSPQPIVEARATTTDGGNPQSGDPQTATVHPAASPTSAGAPHATASPGDPTIVLASAPGGNGPPNPTPDSALRYAAEQPPATNWPAPPAVDAAPPAQPIAGPVPLPRKRPHTFRVAMGPIPLPRPRPEDATTTAAPAPQTTNTVAAPIQFIRNLFQPHQNVQPENVQPDAAPPEPAEKQE